MERLYRTMRSDPDGLPTVGRSARALGVRVEARYIDVHPDPEGRIVPGTGGMSVTVDDPRRMLVARRSRWLLQGASEDPLFVIEAARIVAPLRARVDVGAHALVEPTTPRPVEVCE